MALLWKWDDVDLKALQLQRHERARSRLVNDQVKIQRLPTVSPKCFQKKPYAAELYKDPDHPSVSILTGLGPHRTSDGETPNLLISMS